MTCTLHDQTWGRASTYPLKISGVPVPQTRPRTGSQWDGISVLPESRLLICGFCYMPFLPKNATMTVGLPSAAPESSKSPARAARSLKLPSGGPPGLVDLVLDNHVLPHRQPYLSDISPLTCNQENLTRCESLHQVRLERYNTCHRRSEIRIHRIAATLGAAEVRRTNERNAHMDCY